MEKQSILIRTYGGATLVDNSATGSIIGENGWKIKRYVRSLMKNDLVYGVGTDAHNLSSRAPKMRKAAEYVKKKFGEDYMRRIFFENAAALLRKKREV